MAGVMLSGSRTLPIKNFNFEFATAYDADTRPDDADGGCYTGELENCYAVRGTSLTAPFLELMKVHCIML